MFKMVLKALVVALPPMCAAIAIAVTLEGCASAEQLAVVDDSKCQSYGFSPGSEGYAQCRMSQDAARQQARVAAATALAAGLQRAGDAYGNMPLNWQQPPPAMTPPPAYCVTRAIGTTGNSTTTCQ